MKFKVGDRVSHSRFGTGTIANPYRDCGYMWEVQFDTPNACLHKGRSGTEANRWWCDNDSLIKLTSKHKVKPKYSVGDRVSHINWGLGTVIKVDVFDKGMPCLIEFDDEYSFMHKDNGVGKPYHCWWPYAKEFEVIDGERISTSLASDLYPPDGTLRSSNIPSLSQLMSEEKVPFRFAPFLAVQATTQKVYILQGVKASGESRILGVYDHRDCAELTREDMHKHNLGYSYYCVLEFKVKEN